MATDGIKIIDGDTAHDTYSGIMDLYDSGANFATINKKFPLIRREYFDDFDNEIYVTTCGLAYWEIGQMTVDRLEYIKKVINKGACVKEWLNNDTKDGKARRKELDKYWKKISSVNNEVRQRKKYRKITHFHFPVDSILTFKLNDNRYRAVICAKIKQYRGQCSYVLIPTTYRSLRKPTADTLKKKEILGRRIGCSYDKRTIKLRYPGIERVWKFIGGNCKFIFGLVEIAVDHKDFVNFKDNFEVAGELKILEGLKETGSLQYERNYKRFEEIFSDLDKHSRIFRYGKFPINILCNLKNSDH